MVLNQARHVIMRSALKDVAEALVFFSVRYCMPVYGSCGETQLRRVQKLIKISVRNVTRKKPYNHISGSIAKLGWVTELEAGTECSECLNGGALACIRHPHNVPPI